MMRFRLVDRATSYDPREIGIIRDAIDGKISLTDEETKKISEEIAPEVIKHGQLGPLIATYHVDRELYNKLWSDANIKGYTHMIFLPGIFELLYDTGLFDARPKHSVACLSDAKRGKILVVESSGKKLVAKSEKNSLEQKISVVGEQAGLGPKQIATSRGYVVEEFVEGARFSDISLQEPEDEKEKYIFEKPELYMKHSMKKNSYNNLFLYGRKIGAFLKEVHKSEILFNNSLLTDIDQNSHAFINSAVLNEDIRIIDFGNAISEEHTNLNDDAFFRYVSSFSKVRRFLNQKHMNVNEIDEKTKSDIIKTQRYELFSRPFNEQSKTEYRLVMEEAIMLSYEKFFGIAEPFIKGLKEGYAQKKTRMQKIA